MRPALTALCLSLLLSPAAAQTPRYERWQGQEQRAEAQDQRTQGLVEELRALIDEAEQARAADRRFLSDLRDLVRRYDRPWQVELLHDDFRDGDFLRAPAWTVISGRFAVERGLGLRSVVFPPRQPPPEPTPQPPAQRTQRQSQQDIANALLKAILEQRSGRQEQGTRRTEPAPPAPRPPQPRRAEIRTAVALTNAFEIRLELSSWSREGRLEFGPYREGEGSGGYRLAYTPGLRPTLSLLRLSSFGTSVIQVHDQSLNLEDGSPHTLEWTRDRHGEMAVSLDGEELFRTTDRAFPAPFAGFALVNLGGDYAVREITIRGTKAHKPALSVPATPSGVSASDGTFSYKIAVTWNAIPTTTIYHVSRATSPMGTKTLVGQTAGTLANHQGQGSVQGTIYYFWVQACNNSGCSAYSAPDSGYLQ